MSEAGHDLDVLRREAPAAPAPRRVGRLLVGLLVVALLGAAFVVLRPLLQPVPEVRVARVKAAVPVAGDLVQRSASLVAAGWIEADPYPISVRPLLRGVVRTLHVLEGQPVVEGETLIATLDNLEVRNEQDLAAADVALRESELALATKQWEVAERILEQRLAPRQRVRDLEGLIASANRSVARAQAQRQELNAEIETARVDVRAQEALHAAGGIAPVALDRAKAHLASIEVQVGARDEAIARRVKDVARLKELLVLAQEGRDDPRALAGAVSTTQAARDRAQRALEKAQTRLRVAKRNADHLTVVAPMTGTVLRLNCAPGAVAGPQGEFMGAGEASATGALNRLTGALVTLYDPKRLQARIDVPLAEVSGIAPGAVATLEVDSAPGQRYTATVTRLVHEADLSKNTLQVKLSIDAPDERLRPEMLCRASFSPAAKVTDGGQQEQSARNDVWIVPDEAVREGHVLVFDPRGGGRARRLAVEVLRSERGETRVRGDLGRSTRVLLDSVPVGTRVKPQEQAR